MNEIEVNEKEMLKNISNFINAKLGCDFEPEAVTEFQRFPAPDKPATNKACWLIISEDLKAATCGSFITGEKYTWHAEDFSSLSKECREQARQQAAKRRAMSEAERQQTEAIAAKKAKDLFEQSPPAKKHHSYLTIKLIKPHGLRQDDVKLLIPLLNDQGDICSLQYIYPDGSKSFFPGGRTKEAYSIVGKIGSSEKLYVCEGWATAATIHQETGHPVVAAMTANNLLPVCLLWKTKVDPSVEIIVAADNDHSTKGNPGLTKAHEAAETIVATLVVPPVPCQRAHCKCTDFNDLRNCFHYTQEIN